MSGNMPMHDLEQAVLGLWPRQRWRETRILIAVSGGADSVALLRAMLNLAPDNQWIDAAHFNHGWRGAESDQDEQFVRELCATHAVRFYAARADGAPGIQTTKSEEFARTARYEFLTQVAYTTGARYVVTAHTGSDRIETLLHNLFRGTGLAGAAAPTFSRSLDRELVLVRPLLDCSRETVLDYLHFLGQAYREDSSNNDQSFRRNFLRQALLPLVREQYGASVDDKLLSFCELADEANSAMEFYAGEYLRQAELLASDAHQAGELERLDRSMFALPTPPLLAAPWPVVHKALTFVWLDRGWPLGAMTRMHWDTFRRVFDGDARAPNRNLPGDLRLTRSDAWLMIDAERSG